MRIGGSREMEHHEKQHNQKQHNRIVILVGIIVAISAVSLWREFSHLSSTGWELNFDDGAQTTMIGASILVALGFISMIWHRSIKDNKRVERLSYIDEMTGLPNRRHFDLRLQEELDRCKRHGGKAAVMYLDLDQFQSINDCYGQDAGDLAIQTFGKRIRATTRAEDTVSRLASDEFAVLMSEVQDIADVRLLADRILEAMRQPIKIEGRSAYVGVSIGGTMIQNGEIDVEEALRQAEFALLQAKGAGRNQLQVFDPEMAEAIKSRKLMEADLRRAVEEDCLHVEYQPKVSHDGSEILGVEALVRWNHPDAGAISPATFIPIAEEIGLIERIGEMVLRQACMDIKDMESTKLAVNVSPVQFRKANFVELVKSVLQETGFDPKQLELEITEGIFIANPDETVETIKELRSLGVCIALDDFGTGYSSLSYLREFPLDRIKIDRSFVNEMENSRDALQLISTMIELGSGLGLNVTVEGVETSEQRALLENTGCDELQGFLFSRPVSAERLKEIAGNGGLDTPKSETRPRQPVKLALVS